MNPDASFCSHCGSALTPGKRFCEQCGAPAAAPPAARPPERQTLAGQPAGPAARPPAQPPDLSSHLAPSAPAPARPASRSKGCGGMALWIATALAVAALACVGLLGIGGMYLLGRSQTTPAALQPAEQASAQQPALVRPTSAPPTPAHPTAVPTIAVPTTAAPQSAPAQQVTQPPATPAGSAALPAGQTAGQELTGSLFRDNFESTFMGWDSGSDSEAEWGYQDGAYLLRTRLSNQPLSFSPPITTFSPTAYEFDAAASGQPGDGGTGTFGVLCDYSPADESNYIAVEIDPYNQVFLITRFENSQAGASTGFASHPGLRPNPGDINHYLVECQWTYVTLFINNEWAAELELDEPIDGGMGLFIANWGPTSPDSFQVLIDNFSAWVPVQ